VERAVKAKMLTFVLPTEKYHFGHFLNISAIKAN